MSNKNSSQIEFPGCHPKKIMLVMRHGVRHPSTTLIRKVNGRLNEIRNLILENNANSSVLKFQNKFENHSGILDLEVLKVWTHELEETFSRKLSNIGRKQTFEFAQRLQQRFPTLFPSVYDNKTYNFRATQVQRSEESVTEFAKGLFGKNSSNHIWYQSSIQLDLDRTFYRECPRWMELVDENFEAFKEYRLFKTSPPVNELVRNVNKMLNMENILTIDDVYLMYYVCSLEVTWNKTDYYVWCSVFTTEMLQLLEYGKDIEYYIRHGYANKINYKLACPLFQHIIEYFESDEEYPTTSLYFSHSGSVLKMLVLLGLYKDKEPMKHADMYNLDREWSLNKVNPFGSNLVFVLFRCGSTKKVAVLHLENLIRLPNWEDDICDLSKMKEQYIDKITSCDFDEACGL